MPNICQTCKKPFEVSLRAGPGWCQHDSAQGITRLPGWKMAKSEYDGRSEALLEHDSRDWLESGEVRTRAELQAVAAQHGWNEQHDKKLVEHIAKRKGLR